MMVGGDVKPERVRFKTCLFDLFKDDILQTLSLCLLHCFAILKND